MTKKQSFQVITQKDLVRALARLFEERKGIEEKVSPQSIVEEEIRRIERSSAWLDHQKTHSNARLEILDPFQLEDMKGLQDLLPKEQPVHYSHAPEQFSGYGQRSPQSSPQNTYLSTSEQKMVFWANCTCGMTFKNETNKHEKSNVVSYGAEVQSSPTYGTENTNQSYSNSSPSYAQDQQTYQ